MHRGRHGYPDTIASSCILVLVCRDGTLVGMDVTLYSNAGCSLDLSSSVMDRALFHIDNCYRHVCRHEMWPWARLGGRGAIVPTTRCLLPRHRPSWFECLVEFRGRALSPTPQASSVAPHATPSHQTAREAKLCSWPGYACVSQTPLAPRTASSTSPLARPPPPP